MSSPDRAKPPRGMIEAAATADGDRNDRNEVDEMKRALMSSAGLYLLFAVIGRFVEGMGAVECGCADDCWCKRPVIGTFRWVFPWGHR